MKKIYSLMMLAIAVVALGFTACGNNDDDDNSSGGNSKKTLIINGKPYYCGDGCTVTENSSRGGMRLKVIAVEDAVFQLKGSELVIEVSPSKVAELSVGQVFDAPIIRNYRGINELDVVEYDWDVVDGDILVKHITEKELTIQLNKLTIKHERTGVEYTFEGTAPLHNSLWVNGDYKPFF